MVHFHIAIFSMHIHYAGKPSPIAGGESGFIKIHIFQSLGVESGEKPSEMIDLIQLDSVYHIQVLVSIPPTDIHPG